MENKGKLLVSTKTGSGMKMVQTIFSIFMLLLSVFFIFALSSGIFREMGKDIFDNNAIGNIIGIILIALMFAYPVLVIIGNRSYCNVYENSVVGITGMNLSHLSHPMERFELSYNEIYNVTESGKTLFIRTSYKTFEVLAMKNRTEAVKEIRQRMTGIYYSNSIK